ncbi:MAG: MFS transporter [Armatimonadetes bacterium]|nr:MFS transporter [Armatimonadota bacterium]
MSVLKIRGFRNLWIGQTVSQFGDAVYGMLFIYMADKLTKDPLIVGGVAACAGLPFLLVGPVAGVFADRHDRKNIMLGADLVSALTLVMFAFVLLRGQPPVWALFAVPLFLSSINAFFTPARGAAVPALVPGEQLLSANSLSSATQYAMNAVGLIAAALLLAPLEAIAPTRFFLVAVLVNAASFLVSAGFIATLPRLLPVRDDSTEAHWLQDLKEGAGLIWKHCVLRIILGVSLLINLAISGFMVVYTATNRAWFGGNFLSLAIIELTFMVPVVIASLVVGQIKVTRVGVAYALCMVAIGAAVAVMGFARNFWLYVSMNFLCGVALPFATIPAMTYINLTVPDGVRGRVNAVSAMVTAGVQPVGAGLAGVGLKVYGLTTMYLAMGIGMLVPPLAALFGSKEFRDSTMPRPS